MLSNINTSDFNTMKSAAEKHRRFYQRFTNLLPVQDIAKAEDV